MGTRIDSIAVVSGGLRRRHSARRLADAAARACLADADVAASDVDLLVNAGMYRDGNLGEPALAALIQEDIDANPGDPPVGGPGTFSFDVANGSCGVLTGLQLVDGLLATGTARRALVVASDANPGRGMTRTFPFDAAGGAALCDWDDATAGLHRLSLGGTSRIRRALRRGRALRRSPQRARRPRGARVRRPSRASAPPMSPAKLLADHGVTTRDVDAIIACPLSHGFVDGAHRRDGSLARSGRGSAVARRAHGRAADRAGVGAPRPGCSTRAYAALRRGGRRDHDRHRALPAVSAPWLRSSAPHRSRRSARSRVWRCTRSRQAPDRRSSCCTRNRVMRRHLPQ